MEEKNPFINNLNLDFISVCGVTLNKRDYSYVFSCTLSLSTVALNVFLTGRKLGGSKKGLSQILCSFTMIAAGFLHLLTQSTMF